MCKDTSCSNNEYGKLKKDLIITVVEIILAIIIGIAISTFIVANTEVPTGSMIPTIEERAMLMSNRTAYWFSKPKRGDIVIFEFPDDNNKLLIKRVIGLPGDKIEGKEGNVYINNVKLDESAYINKAVYTNEFGPYTVPNNCYFMMGDNREHSLDSRYWKNKFVSKDNIIAQAWFEYKPTFKKLN